MNKKSNFETLLKKVREKQFTYMNPQHAPEKFKQEYPETIINTVPTDTEKAEIEKIGVTYKEAKHAFEIMEKIWNHRLNKDGSGIKYCLLKNITDSHIFFVPYAKDAHLAHNTLKGLFGG